MKLPTRLLLATFALALSAVAHVPQVTTLSADMQNQIRGGVKSLSNGTASSTSAVGTCGSTCKILPTRVPVVLTNLATQTDNGLLSPMKAYVEHRIDDLCSLGPALAMRDLLADDFHQDPLAPTAVELAVEDLLPVPEVELGLGDRYHDFAPHDLPLHVGVSVIFAGAVVPV